MKVSLQIVDQPADSPAPKRVVVLSSNGGRIGRSFDCDLQLPAPSISRVQLKVVAGEDGFSLLDQGRNPTKLNDQFLPRGVAQPLYDGDLMTISGYRVLVTDLRKDPGQRQRTGAGEVSGGESAWGEGIRDLDFSNPMEASDQDLLDALDAEQVKPSEPRLDYVGNEIVNELASSAVVPKDRSSQGEAEGADVFAITPDMDVLRGVDLAADGSIRGATVESESRPFDVSDFVDAELETTMFHNVNPVVIPRSDPESIGDHRLYERLLACIDDAAEEFLSQFDPTYLEALFLRKQRKRMGKHRWLWQTYRSHYTEQMQERAYHASLKNLLLKHLQAGVEQDGQNQDSGSG